MTKEYLCTCGKVFTNPQSFNGHKRHCKEHLLLVGKLGKIEKADRLAATNAAQASRVFHNKKSAEKLNQWISEKHTCEKCGKVMVEKFGSGRFCSRSCANGHTKSDTSKIKVSETLRGYKLSNEEIEKLLKPKEPKVKEIYRGPDFGQHRQR